MRTADLHVGQDVFVWLPYDAGTGRATILEINEAGPTSDPRATIVVRFWPGEGPSYKHDRREIRPRDIVKQASAKGNDRL